MYSGSSSGGAAWLEEGGGGVLPESSPGQPASNGLSSHVSRTGRTNGGAPPEPPTGQPTSDGLSSQVSRTGPADGGLPTGGLAPGSAAAGSPAAGSGPSAARPPHDASPALTPRQQAQRHAAHHPLTRCAGHSKGMPLVLSWERLSSKSVPASAGLRHENLHRCPRPGSGQSGCVGLGNSRHFRRNLRRAACTPAPARASGSSSNS